MKKYDLNKFSKSVEKYKKLIGNVKGKSVLIVLHPEIEDAFFSLAPLSMAFYEKGADLRVDISNESLDVLKRVWTLHSMLESGVKSKETKLLKEFIAKADKLCKGNIKNIFSAPDIFLTTGKDKFYGKLELPFLTSWKKKYREEILLKTTKRIWNHVYNIKKKDKISIGFELLRKKSLLGHPLEDYLDSFRISFAMYKAKSDQVVKFGSSFSRESFRDAPERIGELKATLLGCELSKDINEPIFKSFKKLSKLLRIHELLIPSAVFFIKGKGYGGRHYFGEYVGYPSPNKKTRWQTPGQILYKLDFYPQTKYDSRKPKARIAFTSTVPLDIFIKSCYIDWLKMAKRDKKIMNILDKCDHIIVKGEKFGKFQTDLKIGLVKKGKRRYFRGSDVATRDLIRKDILKRTGVYAGNMGNIPAGEAFVTPEYVKGVFLGDVVISIDTSYRLGGKNPLVIECKGNDYKILKGPKKIIEKFNKKKREGMKQLLEQEKNKSLPKEIIALKKKNFNNIGEFAINTNPKAELCDYLIVNEKIANMIHIALGSGFDPDRSTVYHTDIVIDAPRQKLAIYGVDKNGKKHFIHKKGKFVI